MIAGGERTSWAAADLLIGSVVSDLRLMVVLLSATVSLWAMRMVSILSWGAAG